MADGPSAARTRAVATAALVVAFLAGIAAGFTVDWLDLDEAILPERHEPERRHGGTLEGLDLSAEQRARIDAIMAERERQMEAFWETAGPRLRTIVESARSEIRTVLTPEQREEFDRRIAEREARRRERAERDRDRKPDGG